VLNVLAVFVLLAVGGDGSCWPSFLGAGHSQIDPDTIPRVWSPQQNIAWQAALPGHGQSSPVVWKQRVYVTSVEGAEKETCHVTALALADGAITWKHSFGSSDPVKNSLYVSRAAPTPVVDEQGVVAFFESGDVVALGHDGHVRWQRSLSTDYGRFKNKFGLAASPVQTERAVIVLVDDEGPSYLVAIDKRDGSVLWKTDRTSRVSWSSPALVEVAGKPQVVCSSAGSIDAYDPASGRPLWTKGNVGGNTAATPLDLGGGVFLVGASPGREGEGARAEDARQSNFAMKVEAAGDNFAPTILWKTEQATPSFGSPMVHAGHAYWVNRSGVVFCFDAATGEPCYTERIKQSCWATPLGLGDRVYFFGKDGLTTVLAAGPKFQILSENQAWDPDGIKPVVEPSAAEETEERRRAAAMFSGPTLYGVAAVNGSLLMRSGQTLYCVRNIPSLP
jgi:outer membrane protein assembly factor BamB